MPRIDRSFLDSTVYLYPNATAARKGTRWGGSGFLIAVPYEQDINGVRRSHVYVVTNSHVVREYSSTVIRLNTRDGHTEIISKKYEDWIDDWEEDDLAICMLDDTIMSRFRWIAPLPQGIVTADLENHWSEIDIGTEVIVIARFIAHDGKQENLPVALFGNISMLNWEPIQHPDRRHLKQESFLIQAKAFAGTSGSPVFVAQLPAIFSSISNVLLGIVWGYAYTQETVRRKKNNQPIKEMYVNVNTGMMLVIPGWKLVKFLYRDDLVSKRRRIEEEAIKENEN